METLSRVDKYRKEKENGKGTKILYWFLSALFFALFLYVFYRFAQIPMGITERNGLEMGLFLCSLLFLGVYVQSFAIISTKKITDMDVKEVRANPFLIIGWAISLTYHLFLWLAGARQLSPLIYEIAIIFSVAFFLLTVLHFLLYFAYVKKEREWRRVELLEKNKKGSEKVIELPAYIPEEEPEEEIEESDSVRMLTEG